MTRDLGDLMWAAAGERAGMLDGLAPEPAELTEVRARVRRGRTVRHVREAAVALPVIAAVAAAGWFGLDRLAQPEPPVTTPEPVQPSPDPTPDPTPTPTPEEIVLGDPIDEPGVPTYYAMPDGLLDHVSPGWVLATYAPRVYGDGFPPPPFELVFLVDSAGTRFLVARLDPGTALDGAAETWVEHAAVSWRAGETAATLREVRFRAESGGTSAEDGDLVRVDLATGAVTPADGVPDPLWRDISPDGSMVISWSDVGDGAEVFRLADGQPVAELPTPGPAGWCRVVTWWTADSLLVACLDEDPDADGGDGILVTRHPRLVVLPLDGLESSPGTTVREFVIGEPWPSGGPGVATHVSDGVVAWQGTELSAEFSDVCPTGVYLQTGDRIERLPASSDPRVELNIFEARAVDGVVYVDATGGCSGDMRPRILTRYDPATGATTELVPPPPEVVDPDQWWLQGLSSYVIAD